MRIFPSRGRKRLRIWIARSVEHRYKTVLLNGLDVLNEAADGGEESPFGLGDIMVVKLVFSAREISKGIFWVNLVPDLQVKLRIGS